MGKLQFDEMPSLRRPEVRMSKEDTEGESCNQEVREKAKYGIMEIYLTISQVTDAVEAVQDEANGKLIRKVYKS